ncbi:MAG: RNA 2'-phosphotransferase [Archaeoglobales archaeon]|nr:MAG: RNA 2'-phosphotransferase [Archaeoglobales archaeon]
MLRHFPSKFGLEVDRYGWANLKDVVEILKRRYGVGRDVLELIVESDPKLRFEIKGEKIRARYGHSIDVEVDWSESDEVPKILYHGTNPKNLRSILREGLKPMKRREVHLSDSLIDALEVGKRHHPNPIVLVIDTECLSRFGRLERRGVFTRLTMSIQIALV